MEFLVSALQNGVFKGRIEKNLTLLAIKTEEISLLNKPYLIAYSELMNVPTPPRNFDAHYFEYAETLQGRTVNKILELAITLDLHIIGTIFEKSIENNEVKYYNTAFICSPTQGLIGKYRKSIILKDNEKLYFSDYKNHDSEKIFELDNGIKIGILLGEDFKIKEEWNYLSQNGVQLIVIPLAIIQNFNIHIEQIINDAQNYKVNVLIVNKAGEEIVQNTEYHYIGNSCLINKDGLILNEVRQDEWYSFIKKTTMHNSIY